MAENVTLDPTTTSGGAVVHTDELSSGAHVQRIKIGLGDPGVYADVSSSNPLPVSVGSTVTVTGTVTATPSGVQAVSDGAVVGLLGGTLSTSDGAVVGLLGGTLSVSDGAVVSALGGTLTVDGSGVTQPVSVAATISTSDGAVVAAINALSSNGAVLVSIQKDDVGIGGGTQYSVGTSGLASAGTGTLMIAVRDDSLTTLANGEGEGVPLRVSATGALHVTGGGGGTEYTEDAAAAANPVGGAILLVRADTPAAITNTDGDNIAQRATNYGAAYTQIVSSSGSFVDTFGGGTQYSVGAGSVVSNGTGTLVLATRDDTLSALASGEGEPVPYRVDANGALWTHKYKAGSVIDSGNSTAGTIAANGDFIGVGVDLTGYTSVAVTIKATEPSTTNGMTFQFSTDNTNWDDTYTYTYSPSDTSGARRFQFPVTSRYFRVNWTQGPSAATARIQTILHTDNILTSIHRAQDNVDPDRSAQLVKSVLIARQSGAGDFIPIQSTAGGNLKVSVEEVEAGVVLSVSDGAVVAALGDVAVSVGNTVTVTGTVTANAGTGTMSVSDGAVVSQLSGTLSVSDGAIVSILNSAADTTGALVVRAGVDLEGIINYHDQTVTTGSIAVSSGFTAGGAGIYNYITDVSITNSSSTNTVCQLRDGAAGQVIWTFPVPANGGVTSHFTTPIKQTTANTVLAFDPLTAVTTLYISIGGFQAAG